MISLCEINSNGDGGRGRLGIVDLDGLIGVFEFLLGNGIGLEGF